jgi:hypothetical protein
MKRYTFVFVFPFTVFLKPPDLFSGWAAEERPESHQCPIERLVPAFQVFDICVALKVKLHPGKFIQPLVPAFQVFDICVA